MSHKKVFLAHNLNGIMNVSGFDLLAALEHLQPQTVKVKHLLSTHGKVQLLPGLLQH